MKGVFTPTFMYLFAVTYDRGRVCFYQNARLINETRVHEPVSTSEMPLLIGADYPFAGYAAQYFEGVMDEIMIFDKALPSTRIHEIYVNGKR